MALAVVSTMGTWSRSPASRRGIYAAAAALGLATYLVVYGPALLGTSEYWEMPSADERMYLMGYRYYLAEPWGWPLFANHTINVPHVTSIAFWDCIPIWALIHKVIATLIPPWADFTASSYLGLWHALTYVLQACLGVALLRALGHRSWREGLVTALFFLAIPAWIYRHWHDALAAHWLELWALCLYVRVLRAGQLSIRQGVSWLSLLALGSLISPYHPVMCLGLCIATLLQNRDLRSLLFWLPAALVTILVSTWLAGYFSEPAIPQWGFEHESTNMLSWLVPLRSGIAGDGRWIANVMATPWQYEGYAYLGLGVLILLVAFLPQLASLRGVIGRHPFLFAVALAFWILALSTHVYFGSHRILEYRLPWFLRFVEDQFRSPGRFVWIPMYVLIAFLLHRAFVRSFLVVVVALLVQIVDATGDWKEHHDAAHGVPGWRVLDLPSWRRVVHKHDRVHLEPSYKCMPSDEQFDRRNEVALQLQMLASERTLPINGTYTARPVRDCAEEARAWATARPVPGTLYVFLPEAGSMSDRFRESGLRCARFADGRICSADAAAIDRAIADGIAFE